jgi:tRNA threonylcarbamoyladenosine biosynthesis protein TsaB
MNILALDTSMGACSAAVLRAAEHGRQMHALQVDMTRGHAEALIPMVEEVMTEASLEALDLDLIAATTGPGSFTGVRIAVAAARGLALVTGAQLFGSDSLTVMARGAVTLGATSQSSFAVAVDARRGMLYFGLYDGAGRLLDGPSLIGPDDAASELPPELHFAVGSGGPLLAEAASSYGRHVESVLPELQPSAEVLARIAAERGKTTDVLRPLYLRAPDAKPQAPAIARR